MPKLDTPTWIESLRRLRRIRQQVAPALWAELDPIEENLEEAVGPTVRPADAASLLGVSKPALKRWLDRGEVAAVMTPRGRREIPLGELLDLLDEVDEVRETGVARPLTRVIRDRARVAEEAIDIDRLLPRSQRRTHRTAELQALAYHRLVSERLDEQLVDQARRRLDRWHRMGRIDPRWYQEWDRVLSRPIGDIRAAISADTPAKRQLRQTSPFAGTLTEQERRLLTKAVSDRAPA